MQATSCAPPLHPNRTLVGLSILILAAMSAADAATYSVGNDANCSYATVQEAINAATGAGPHLIRIKTRSFAAQAITVSGKDITLRGGHTDCVSTTATSRSTLSGSGGTNSSVFGVTGSGNDVILENLNIINGDELSQGSGGGIDFRGDGFLTLRNTVVSDNHAGSGGGIYFVGNGELRVEADSLVLRNTAQHSGGGIYIAGSARLLMTAPGTAIQSNMAIEDGGGVAVFAPARLSIGSPGLGNTGALYDNSARHGGAIAGYGNDTGTDSYISLYSSDAGVPLRLHQNRASQDGGAIYLRPYSGGFERSAVYLTAQNIDIDHNSAAQGSALYLGPDFAVTATVTDSRINDNINQNSSQQATAGATILLHENTQLAATRVQIRRNMGGQVLRMLGDATDSYLQDCLIVSNMMTQQLLWQEGGGSFNSLNLKQCTIAGNSIGAGHVVSSSHDFELLSSIVDQPGKTTLVFGGGTRNVDDVIASEIASLGSSPSIIARAPRFIDPMGGDFHLQAASPAVDYSGLSEGFDLDGYARGLDLALVPDRFGSGDLGAYERLGVGNLVLNRGFLSDLRLWDVVRPGVSQWNDLGAGSAGSVDISYTREDLNQPPAGILIGLSQCVRLPGPGSYRLSGFAYGNGSSFERDQVSLRWAFRAHTGGEACEGAITSEGIVTFPNAANFVASNAPAIITVPTEQWTHFSSIVISLAVVEGSNELLTTTTGHFDGIVLEPIEVLSIELFADGFE